MIKKINHLSKNNYKITNKKDIADKLAITSKKLVSKERK